MISEPQGLSEAVAAWLHYKSLTGLSGLIKESSMSVPIAEFLSSRFGSEVESEKAHPLFANGALGRPKQIDFVRVKRGDRTWHAAYECKFQTQSQALIVEDLCRLVSLAQVREIGTPARYFVYAAKNGSEEKIFQRATNTGDGSRLLFFDNIMMQGKEYFEKSHSFKLLSLHERQKGIFRDSLKKYKLKIPSSVVTELKGWSKAGDYCCAVWKVTAAQGSALLSAEDL